MILIITAVVALSPAQFLQTEVTLSKGRTWSSDFILAPGDSLTVNVECLRTVSSSCGPFGWLGDVLLKKGDNVGEARISEWHGNVITSAWEQNRPQLSLSSAQGGALTLTVANHSGHRANVYAVKAWRTPTAKKYVGFQPTFEADTTAETTWTKQTKQRLIREDILHDTTWETVHDSTLLSVDTITEDVLDEAKHIPAGATDITSFGIPADAVKWAYWVGVEEAYSAMKQLLGAAAKAAGFAVEGPVAAFAVGKLADLSTGTSSNSDIGCTLNQSIYGSWSPIVLAGRVKDSYRRRDGSGSYCFGFDNSYSILTDKTVHVKVVAVKVSPSYSVSTRNEPRVKIKKVPIYQDYDVNVPSIDIQVQPKKTWLPQR
jgi:hypothetical protein